MAIKAENVKWVDVSNIDLKKYDPHQSVYRQFTEYFLGSSGIRFSSGRSYTHREIVGRRPLLACRQRWRQATNSTMAYHSNIISRTSWGCNILFGDGLRLCSKTHSTVSSRTTRIDDAATREECFQESAETHFTYDDRHDNDLVRHTIWSVRGRE